MQVHRRVVSCFLLRSSPPPGGASSDGGVWVALFQRRITMPTFGGRWAVISGSLEVGEGPFQTARRELDEETNLLSVSKDITLDMGLYLDVNVAKGNNPNDESPGTKKSKIFRVYPFAVELSDSQADTLALRGTEHEDTWEWVTPMQLQEREVEGKCVPNLWDAFARATKGRYLTNMRDRTASTAIRAWAADQQSGASDMARAALRLLIMYPTNSLRENMEMGRLMIGMRPTMVPLVHVIQSYLDLCGSHEGMVPTDAHGNSRLLSILQEAQMDESKREGLLSACIQEWLERPMQEAVSMGETTIRTLLQGREGQVHVAVFSRSGTLRRVLLSIEDQVSHVSCGQSSPGDEGIAMASDLQHASWAVECLPDQALIDRLEASNSKSPEKIDLLLVGTDCVHLASNQMINKVGTRALAAAARKGGVPVVCIADRTKVWDKDDFLPPLEWKLFEKVPLDYIDHLILPGQ